MQEIADKYQEEIDQKFTNMIATLEPTLVIILSLIVGMILLSVMLPLMGIMSSL
jgi:type IV pilus assembly protein PilC